MPRGPRGKRLRQHDGSIAVVHKNPNGDGSVYYENASRRTDGTPIPGRWRATYLDASGRRRSVSAPTRATAEARRAEQLGDLARRPTTASRFSRATTIAELADWWLDSVARHQVKTSTLDSYRKFTSYLVDDLGPLAVVDVGPETLTDWQSRLLDRLAPFTVLNCRKVCRQAFAEAVKIGLLSANPFDVVKAPPARGIREGKALSPDDARKLIEAAGSIRLGATVTLLFCQGWRVSEVLGLAWEDIDFVLGTAHIRRAAVCTTSTGVALTTTKTSGAEGVHHLAPVSIAHLRARRSEQERERDVLGDAWPLHLYEGSPVSPVFTTTTGTLVNRQAVTKTIERAALKAGLDSAGLATHAGRRTVITALYADGNVDLADIARHVGNSDTSTTAGYVKNLGKRPETTARKAAELLDPSLR